MFAYLSAILPGRRASMEAKNAAPRPIQTTQTDVSKKRVMKIGRPGYKVKDCVR